MFLRLTPVYAVIIFFFATLQYKMGSGPLWEAFIGSDRNNCQQTWWLSLLYLNNYVATDKTVETHYSKLIYIYFIKDLHINNDFVVRLSYVVHALRIPLYHSWYLISIYIAQES